jgi:hypothetical protein
MVEHSLPGRVEVVDAEEEVDASGELLTCCAGLLLAIGSGQQHPVCAPGGRTTTHRFGRPSLVIAGESSTTSKPRASTKN